MPVAVIDEQGLLGFAKNDALDWPVVAVGRWGYGKYGE